jgi:hypothetical protein
MVSIAMYQIFGKPFILYLDILWYSDHNSQNHLINSFLDPYFYQYLNNNVLKF